MKTKIALLIILALILVPLSACIPERRPDIPSVNPVEDRTDPAESLPSETPEESTSVRETEPPKTDAPSESTETVTETETETEPETEHPDMSQAKRIWVGDSRVVGITECGIGDPEEDIFIGKNGRYYVWFSNDALPILREHLDTGEPFEVIVQIGINDCANKQMRLLSYYAEDYVELINALIDEYPNARFWFLSIGEVIGTYGGNTRWEVKMDDLNPLVGPFNETMKEECRAAYLPIGELIKEEHRSYADNVHYSAETNQWIYDYVLEAIKEANGGETEEEESLTGMPDR